MFFGGSSSSSSSASSSSSGPADRPIFRLNGIHIGIFRWLTLTVALAIPISLTTEEGAVAILLRVEFWIGVVAWVSTSQCDMFVALHEDWEVEVFEGCEEGEGRFQEKGTLEWRVIPWGERVGLWHQSLLLMERKRSRQARQSDVPGKFKGKERQERWCKARCSLVSSRDSKASPSRRTSYTFASLLSTYTYIYIIYIHKSTSCWHSAREAGF